MKMFNTWNVASHLLADILVSLGFARGHKRKIFISQTLKHQKSPNGRFQCETIDFSAKRECSVPNNRTSESETDRKKKKL